MRETEQTGGGKSMVLFSQSKARTDNDDDDDDDDDDDTIFVINKRMNGWTISLLLFLSFSYIASALLSLQMPLEAPDDASNTKSDWLKSS